MENKTKLKWRRLIPNPKDAKHYVDIAHISAGCDYTIHVGKTRNGPENQYFARLTTIGYNPDSKSPVPKPACIDIVKPFTFYTRKDENAQTICLKNLIDWAGQNRKCDEAIDRLYNKLTTYLIKPEKDSAT